MPKVILAKFPFLSPTSSLFHSFIYYAPSYNQVLYCAKCSKKTPTSGKPKVISALPRSRRMWWLTLGCSRAWEQNISELLHPSSTKPFPLDHSWSDLVSQEHNILLRSTIWIIHQEHAAWENKETRKFSAKPEQPVFHRDFILPFSLFTDFSKKTQACFLSWSCNLANTAGFQLCALSDHPVISPCSCRNSHMGLCTSPSPTVSRL